MSKVGVRIIHGNIGILSEFSKSQRACYTWPCHGVVLYTETYGMNDTNNDNTTVDYHELLTKWYIVNGCHAVVLGSGRRHNYYNFNFSVLYD